MRDYTPPVSGLLKLGPPAELETGVDYLALGFAAAHIPELIRLLQDDELAFGDSDTPEVYAQVHAWRALGQLRAPEAVEPLLDLLDEQGDEEWNDWVVEEVPFFLGQIGPGVIPAAAARLEQRGQREHVPCYFANTLVEVAKRFPETRMEVTGHIARALETAGANNASLNGFIIADLVDLRAQEVWPVIEAAFATGNVDESIAGDAAEVKHALGLAPPPPRRSGGWVPALPPVRTGPNAKQRFNERMRKKKAEKKKNKKKRKGG